MTSTISPLTFPYFLDSIPQVYFEYGFVYLSMWLVLSDLVLYYNIDISTDYLYHKFHFYRKYFFIFLKATIIINHCYNKSLLLFRSNGIKFGENYQANRFKNPIVSYSWYDLNGRYLGRVWLVAAIKKYL